MRIIKADEPLLVNNIKVLIYGEPGAGKTSLAFSVKNPVCYDFDEGAHRSAFRKDVWQFDSWGEAASITAHDLKDYDSIIIDTVGRQLDMIAAHVIRANNKLATRAGNLTLQGYGELKSVFAQWVKKITQFGKDIIFIAHNKEEKDGDSVIMRPDIQGSSYGEVFKVADAIGYCRIINNSRTVDFQPTEQHVGKDTAQIGMQYIADLAKSPSYGADLVAKIKDSINNASEAGRKATEEIESYRARLDECNDLGCLNDLRIEIAELKSPLVKDKSKAILIQRMKALDAVWSKEKECFVPVKVDEPTGPRTLEWYESAADSIDNGVFEWWENEKGNARRDLNDDDFAKMESTISQLVDIEGEK
jgi:hypothetical protein